MGDAEKTKRQPVGDIPRPRAGRAVPEGAASLAPPLVAPPTTTRRLLAGAEGLHKALGVHVVGVGPEKFGRHLLVDGIHDRAADVGGGYGLVALLVDGVPRVQRVDAFAQQLVGQLNDLDKRRENILIFFIKYLDQS